MENSKTGKKKLTLINVFNSFVSLNLAIKKASYSQTVLDVIKEDMGSSNIL